jgi:hypothetical protein
MCKYISVFEFIYNLDAILTITLYLSRYSDGLQVRFPSRGKILLFSTTSRPALGPTQPPIQCVRGAMSWG